MTLNNRLIKESISSRIFDILNPLFLLIFCITVLYPFWELLVLSFMKAIDATTPGLKIWVSDPTLNAYKQVLGSQNLAWGYFNTIFRTVIGTFLGVFLTFTMAYPLAKRDLPFRSPITIYLLVTMFFSGGLIPTFLLVRSLGLLNTRMALVLPSLISAYNILIMRNFIMAIPSSIEESAYLDGANFLVILVKLIIPLSMPILATISLWVAVYHWNEWFHAMIYTKGQKLLVLQMVLRMTINDASSEDIFLDEIAGEDAIVPRSVQAATVIFTIGPIVLTYPFFQKYFVKGVIVGSLKG